MGHIRLAALGHGKGRQQLGPEHVPKVSFAGSLAEGVAGAPIFAATCVPETGAWFFAGPLLTSCVECQCWSPGRFLGWHVMPHVSLQGA